MAVIEIVAGNTQAFSLDLATQGTVTAVEFKIYVNTRDKTLVYKYKYPVTTGFKAVTLVGTTYTFELSATDSATMLGNYGIEATWTVATKNYRAQAVGITVVKESA